jgi:hypothetical protein
LAAAASTELEIEMRFTIPNPRSRRLFIALCRRYGLKPFRYARIKRQTVIVKAPRTFLKRTLWLQFVEIDTALTSYLDDITDKVIREEVHGEAGDAGEIAEPRAIASRARVGSHTMVPGLLAFTSANCGGAVAPAHPRTHYGSGSADVGFF